MKNLSFLCCEKVIQDTNGQTSLISLIQTMHVVVPDGTELPTNAVGPTPWAIMAVYETTSAESGKRYQQVFHILWPDGTDFNKSTVEFQTNDVGKAIIYAKVQGFPFGQTGIMRVRGWVEENGVKIADVSEYSVGVTHGPIPAGMGVV